MRKGTRNTKIGVGIGSCLLMACGNPKEVKTEGIRPNVISLNIISKNLSSSMSARMTCMCLAIRMSDSGIRVD